MIEQELCTMLIYIFVVWLSRCPVPIGWPTVICPLPITLSRSIFHAEPDLFKRLCNNQSISNWLNMLKTNGNPNQNWACFEHVLCISQNYQQVFFCFVLYVCFVNRNSNGFTNILLAISSFSDNLLQDIYIGFQESVANFEIAHKTCSNSVWVALSHFILQRSTDQTQLKGTNCLKKDMWDRPCLIQL